MLGNVNGVSIIKPGIKPCIMPVSRSSSSLCFIALDCSGGGAISPSPVLISIPDRRT